ncbi:MAG: type I methionyl aminopeptidase [Candidatus Hydrogenedentota bacterium]|nr:MAG: type I methionyl aminopeptidase [Candidatus Hydrogenedentota bacterium]
MAIELKSPKEIETMRLPNAIVVEAHRVVRKLIRPGISTADIDRAVREVIGKTPGATPAFLGYHGFPAATCVSIDEEVVHGIPDPRRVLRAGMLVSVDIGVKFAGFIGDAAVTYPVGKIDSAGAALLKATRESLYKAIAVARIGGRLSDIGAAVENHVVPRGFSVVRDYVGHGVGRRMHEEPQVPNYGPAGLGPVLKAGMTLAIEPMVNEGMAGTRVLDDGWTVVTADGRRSAHFEHSIAITDDGPVILSAGLPDDVV